MDKYQDNNYTIRSYKFRIYPDKTQKEELSKHLELAKNLWNELLYHSKRIYNDYGYFPTKNTLQSMTSHYGLFSQTEQEVSHRLHNSLMRVFKLKKKGINIGFPRFKSIDRMKSLHYPQAGFQILKKKVRISPFGEINVKKQREIKGKIKTLTIKREPTGKWFIILTALQEKEIPKDNKGEKIGMDLGLINFATLSNGKIIKNPRILRTYEEKLIFQQKRLSRKRKKSKNRIKQRLKVSKIHEKIKNIRSDFLHKLSHTLVNTYSLIALEKLNPKEMGMKTLGKSINDASWNNFTNMLSYKAEEAGSQIIFVNPENTTKMCSRCNNLVDKGLNERMHNCPHCGLSIDRDINASINILNRATLGHRESNACGDVTVVTSMNQEGNPAF